MPVWPQPALHIGTHYAPTHAIEGLLQSNTHLKERDSGLNAHPHTGVYSLNLGTGFSFAGARRNQLAWIRAITDVSICQSGSRVTLCQLTAAQSLSLGISQAF